MSKNAATQIYYTNLLNRALSEMKKTAGSLNFVSGALGGVGTEEYETNLQKMTDQIRSLDSRGLLVFNQIPYLDINLADPPNDVEAKFEIFYKGIFQSGMIIKLYVLPGYEKSPGVEKELKYAREKGIEIEFL